ncbi:MAG: sterol desaturase family protein [Bdellovibrionales bacterium]|nr:sterol desaturase family protein [Bdellovibrionales bacterium]
MVYLISAFLILMIWEVAYAKKHGLPVYDFAATVSHLNLGAGQTAINALTAAAIVGAYVWLYDTFHLFEMNPDSKILAAVLIVVADFCYYFGHRASHRVNFFVAAHVVHHQANDFNHGSAIRQSWTSRPCLFLFYAPLAIIGVPVKPLLAALLVNLFIQFFSHNGVVRRKLGFLEYVFVTPRSHRVHHGTNAPYLDKNFAGIFIFWDRLFGSHAELDEKNPVQIGPTEGTNPYDPVNANLSYYRQILFVARHRPTLFGKISIWFETPETLEAEMARFGYVEAETRPILPAYTRDAKIAIVAVLGATLTTLVYYMLNKDGLAAGERAALTFGVLAGAWVAGRLILNPSLLDGEKAESRS